MKRMNLICVVMLLALAGCDNQQSARENGYIQVSAVPLVQQALIGNLPLFQGKPNANIMEHVCSYVAGSLDKAQFEQFFTSHNVDVKRLAAQDAGFKFIAEGDINRYAEGCASYIAAKMFSTTVFFAGEQVGNGQQEQQKLRARLAQLTPTAINVARYIAGLAADSSNKNYDSLDAYKAGLNKRIADTARNFVSNVMQEKIYLADYQPGGKQAGYALTVEHSNITLRLNGETWLGNGFAMGKKYTVNIKNDLAAAKP